LEFMAEEQQQVQLNGEVFMVKDGKQKLHTRKFLEDKIIVAPMGDVHWGSNQCDKELFQEHIQWAIDKPNVYVLFMGDQLECATRDSVGAGIYEQDEIIDKQMESFMDVVKPLAETERVLGMHSGNHEERVWKSSGVDLTKMMCRSLGIKYFGYSVHHLLRVGNQSYTMFSTHGNGGSRLPHTKIKAIIDRANTTDVEVYLMGHLHALSHHTRTFYQIDRRSKCVREGEKHFVLTGNYLDHWGGYGEHAGYEMLRKGAPKVKLSGLEKRIKVSI